MNAVPFIVDYRDKLAEEIRSMPDEILPQVLSLIRQLNRKRKVAQIVRQAERLAVQRKHWTREQRIDHLFKVIEEMQQEAMEKGVAIDDEREAAIDD
ncbi:MAG: hypothetical protein J7M27_12675 [Candidatus Latescibacteria bacterium]|nr:hypothetical protein [Candidatus Latescibacterota bacterium]OPX25543.1 MAG: hypothetical protein B1H02_01165 [Candidatus Latescibacteria bacterium 4484_107]